MEQTDFYIPEEMIAPIATAKIILSVILTLIVVGGGLIYTYFNHISINMFGFAFVVGWLTQTAVNCTRWSLALYLHNKHQQEKRKNGERRGLLEFFLGDIDG